MKLHDIINNQQILISERTDLPDAITPMHLRTLESYLDKLWGSLGMDVKFGRHFLERVNDPRNKKQITLIELGKLFKEAYAQYGKKIAQLGPDQEAILSDLETNVNVPFMLKWDSANQKLDLVAKTVMRKPNFFSDDPKFTINESHDNGTFGMLKLSDESANELKNWCDKHNIDCIDPDDLHCTVLYSKKPVPELSKLNDKEVDVLGKIKGWEKLGDALVLELDAPKAAKIHDFMINHGGTSDYPEYIAHTSVMYDVPDDIELPKSLPNFDLIFDKLEIKPIDPDFSAKSSSEETD